MQAATATATERRVLVLACGALAHELLAVIGRNGLDRIDIECLPASLHNRPSEIPGAIDERIERARARHGDAVEVFVGYADCGTGGRLASVCERRGVSMLDGAHCYEFFATAPRFAEIQDAEIGSFYLTDFLVRHFDRMVWSGLGLDRHPELRESYFGGYTRLVYLVQRDDDELLAAAHRAAERLDLPLEVVRTGYGELETTLVRIGGTR